MLLDNRTLAVIFYLTASMITLALFFNAWSVKKYRGSALWVAGELFICLSFYLLSIQGYVHIFAGITLAGAGLIAGLVLLWAGIDRFVGKKTAVIYYAAPFLLHLIITSYYTYFRFDTVIRIRILSFFLLWIAFAAALSILNNLPRRNRPQYIFTSSVFLIFGFFNTGRFIYSFYMDKIPGLYSAGDGLTFAYTVSIVMNLALAVGLLLLSKARFENELLESRDILQSALATKEKLFSVVAHDLRGPVGNISAALKYLCSAKETISKDDCFRFLEPLQEQSDNTFALLERLLVWSKSQNNEIKYNPEIFDIKKLAQDELMGMFPYMARKGIKTEIKIEDGSTLRGDRSLISIVMRNLISNAAKFTHAGGSIEIGFTINSRESMKGFYVKDSGRGMDKDEVRGIIEGRPDVKEGSFGTDGETGTGLGLMLCREFIQINRGKMLIDSEPDAGTTVTVLLPEV